MAEIDMAEEDGLWERERRRAPRKKELLKLLRSKGFSPEEAVSLLTD